MKLFLVVLLTALPATADTIYLTNGGSANGHVTYSNGEFTITARISGKTASATIQRAQIKRIEFNNVVDNPLVPPGWPVAQRDPDITARFKDDDTAHAPTPNTKAIDTVKLRDGSTKTGLLSKIDEQNIQLGTDNLLQRTGVTAIDLGR